MLNASSTTWGPLAVLPNDHFLLGALLTRSAADLMPSAGRATSTVTAAPMRAIGVKSSMGS